VPRPPRPCSSAAATGLFSRLKPSSSHGALLPQPIEHRTQGGDGAHCRRTEVLDGTAGGKSAAVDGNNAPAQVSFTDPAVRSRVKQYPTGGNRSADISLRVSATSARLCSNLFVLHRQLDRWTCNSWST